MMTADELEAAAAEIEALDFAYRIARVLRASHKRQAAEIEARPMDLRTVADLGELAHHKREIRAQEVAMSEAIGAAEAIEARVFLVEEPGE